MSDTELRILALRLAVECEGPKAMTNENVYHFEHGTCRAPEPMRPERGKRLGFSVSLSLTLRRRLHARGNLDIFERRCVV